MDAASSLSANPIALGALGFAVGAVAAILIPQAPQEQAALEDAAGEVRRTVRDMAQDVVDRGSKMAQNVADTAATSAATHGFSTERSLNDMVEDIKSGDMIENAKQVAADVLEASRESQKESPATTSPSTI